MSRSDLRNLHEAFTLRHLMVIMTNQTLRAWSYDVLCILHKHSQLQSVLKSNSARISMLLV